MFFLNSVGPKQVHVYEVCIHIYIYMCVFVYVPSVACICMHVRNHQAAFAHRNLS